MGLGDFLTGFNQQQFSPEGYLGGKLEDIAQRRKNKFALQLKSQAIEDEFLAKKREMELAQNLKVQSPAQFALGANMLQGKQDVDPSLITDPNTQAMVGAGLKPLLGIKAKPAAGETLKYLPSEDEFGNKYYVPVGTKSGKTPLGMSNIDAGKAPAAQGRIAEARAKYDSAHAQLQDIRDTVKKYWGADNFMELPAQYANQTINQLVQDKPELKAFFDDMQARSLRIDKELTGTSRFAKEIVEATSHGLPQMTDTLSTALHKVDNYDNMFLRVKQATNKAYNLKDEEGKPKSTSGLPSAADVKAEIARRAALKQPKGK